MASSKNPQCSIRWRWFLRGRFPSLTAIGGDWDSTGKSRHLAKLAEAGLIERTTFSSKKDHIGYQWVPDKNPDEICYGNPDKGADKYRIAMKRISEILSNSDRAMGPSELARLAGYKSESYIKGAIRRLYRQGFVSKLSKGNHSVCRLTEGGNGCKAYNQASNFRSWRCWKIGQLVQQNRTDRRTSGYCYRNVCKRFGIKSQDLVKINGSCYSKWNKVMHTKYRMSSPHSILLWRSFMCKRICWPTVHLETFHGGIKICGILRPFRRLSCRRPFCLSFKTVSLCALSAHFPDYALGAELAVGAGIGAGLAVLEAFLAIADRHLLALDIGLTARVISAFHDSSFIFRH